MLFPEFGGQLSVPALQPVLLNLFWVMNTVENLKEIREPFLQKDTHTQIFRAISGDSMASSPRGPCIEWLGS